jgi:hypothetical protein
MARLIKCPRCQSQLDVTNISGGSTVRCPDCGANVRIPTGQTGVHPNVQAPIPQAAAAGGTKARLGGRSTDLFRRMSSARAPGAAGRPPSRSFADAESRSGGRRGSNAGLAIGAAVGGVVLIGVLIFAMTSQSASKERDKAEKAARLKAQQDENRRQNEENRRIEAQEQAEYEKQQAAAKAAGKPPPSLVKRGAGQYDVPATFEPGASKQMKGAQPLEANDGMTREYESLAGAGKVDELIRDDNKWMLYIINGLLSDVEPVAKASLQALNGICKKQGVTTESGKDPVNVGMANSAYYRAGEFGYWSEWYGRNKKEISERAGKGGGAANARIVGEDPSKVNWTEIMQYLRAGGGFDEPKRPEGAAYARVQAMGKSAYPYLAGFIDNEDILLGKAAVKVLNLLTGQQRPAPNEGNKAALKAEWETWIKNN